MRNRLDAAIDRLPTWAWIRAKVRLKLLQRIESRTELYVRQRDCLALMEDIHGPDKPIGDVLEWLDASHAFEDMAERGQW